MKRSLLNIFFFVGLRLVLGGCALQAQTDARFFQPGNAPLHFNAGFAGATESARLIGSMNNQWVGIKGHPNTFYLSYDQVLDAAKGGVGLVLMHDRVGWLRTYSAGLAYSLKLTLGEKLTVAPSLKVAYIRKQLIGDSLVTAQPDPIIPDGNTSAGNVDVSPGILFNTRDFYMGASLEHALSPRFKALLPNSTVGGWRVYRRWTAQAGYTYRPKGAKTWSIAAHLLGMLQGRKGNAFGQLSVNGRYKFLLAGAGMNTASEFFFLAGYRHRRFKLSYTYGLVTGSLAVETSGSHEAALTWYFRGN